MTLEKKGIPTATVITHVFERKSRQEAGAFGIADLPLIVLPHPVGQMPRDKLRALAAALGATLDDLLQAAGFLDVASDTSNLPDIKAYLRRKYGIYDPQVLQALETIVTNVQSNNNGTSEHKRNAEDLQGTGAAG